MLYLLVWIDIFRLNEHWREQFRNYYYHYFHYLIIIIIIINCNILAIHIPLSQTKVFEMPIVPSELCYKLAHICASVLAAYP